MKSIKNLAFSAMLTLGAFSAITYTACSKDDCEDVVCSNGGTCVDGNCACPTGWEGTTCQTKVSAKFVGTWAVQETCGGSPSTPYQVTITADPGVANGLLINNLGNYNCTVGGTITFSGLANGMQFTVNDNKCSTQMQASGTLATNGTLTVTYTATYGSPAQTDNCTATMTK